MAISHGDERADGERFADTFNSLGAGGSPALRTPLGAARIDYSAGTWQPGPSFLSVEKLRRQRRFTARLSDDSALNPSSSTTDPILGIRYSAEAVVGKLRGTRPTAERHRLNSPLARAGRNASMHYLALC